MAQQNKEPKVKRFRLTLSDDQTHKALWTLKFSRTNFFVTAITVIVAVCIVFFSIIAYTPVRNFIPGYPDANAKRAAIQNAIVIDSLENVIFRWNIYSENIRRVLAGEDPVKIDSVIRALSSSPAESVSKEEMTKKDSILRKKVQHEEQFELSDRSLRRDLPIEGIHFFTPLKGVVSQGYDRVVHPYVDITAPANSMVKAALGGTVIFAGWNDEAGYTIQIQHDNDIVTAYKHNSKLLKKTGDKVTAGDPIALVGGTGTLSTGDHLHFELWYKGEAIDPTKYISF